MAGVREVDADVPLVSEGDVQHLPVQTKEVSMEARLEVPPSREDVFHPSELLRVVPTGSPQELVPGGEGGRGLVGDGHGPAGGEVLVVRAPPGVGALGGLEPRFFGMGSPVGDEVVDGGGDVIEGA
ncbi:MAG: hypothetical protein KGI89_13530 [Euryarchaeota archaeon]|nr:hypothetical protein [Euryarchaeota archaeon]